MSGWRNTQRRWTPAEENKARAIIEFVAQYQNGAYPVGSQTIAIRLGMSRDEVYDLMPLAAMRSVEAYPGRVLIPVPDPGGALYRITDERQVTLKVLSTRTRQVDTKVRRLNAEAEQWRGRTDLEAVTICAHYDRLLAEMNALAATLDAITNQMSS